MTSFFVYGSLASPAILDVILGQGDAPLGQVGVLSGHRAAQGSGPFPWACPADDHSITGKVLNDLDKDACTRLSFVIEALGGREDSALIQTDNGNIRARFARGTPASPSTLDDNVLQMIELFAAQEIMSYFKRVEASDLVWRRAMILSRAASRQAADTPKPADLRSATDRDQIEVHKVKTPHEGFYLTRSYQLTHPKFDGSTSAQLRREVFVASDAAIVLPYDPVRDRVLIVEQFRMGPFGRGDTRPWMLEPVAGRLDAGETPEQCARRECKEEAGITLRRLDKIASHYSSPGASSEYFHLFLGLCDLPDDAPGLGGLDSEQEDIRIHIVSYDRAMALLDTGEADNGPLILALLWLSKTRDALRASA
ncbi:MAG: NUDIX domain-containing protein [Roseovarius sp.]|nr:NUDIX domain-containing protein [Roseovarius sp.]